MPTVAYIANQCPSPVEPYVVEEVQELRRRGTDVILCSAWRPEASLEGRLKLVAAETLCLQPFRFVLLLRAAWLCLRRFALLKDLVMRILLQGNEPPGRRLRALLHTWLGAYYALLLRGRRVEHIHAHHGYFSSWVAMVAARLSGATFSLTLHGSDVLLHPVYLDVKLKDCKFCLTVSEFNRRHILENYPQVESGKVIVRRMGVAPTRGTNYDRESDGQPDPLVMLAVGRLHPVKNHAFLLQACRKLKDRNVRFLCLIAGEGEERRALERLIRKLALAEEVKLLGHLNRQRLDACYRACDLVVLTSHSEGIPLALMEAMANSRPVLAPDITGIPELVIDGKTGFLYRAGSMNDFVAKVEAIHMLNPAMGPLRHAARRHVLEHFNRDKNLAAFGDLFMARAAEGAKSIPHENSLLQQI
jgi:colanic acid/amylovoran biosynthesis glycosyltransferase